MTNKVTYKLTQLLINIKGVEYFEKTLLSETLVHIILSIIDPIKIYNGK